MNSKSFLRNCLMAFAIGTSFGCIPKLKKVFYVPAFKNLISLQEIKIDAEGMIVYTSEDKKCWVRLSRPEKKLVEIKGKVTIDTSEIKTRGFVKIVYQPK